MRKKLRREGSSKYNRLAVNLRRAKSFVLIFACIETRAQPVYFQNLSNTGRGGVSEKVYIVL